MIPLYEWKQSPFIFKDVSISHNVYEPCTDTYTLIDALYLDKDSILATHPSRCAEIGVGSGYALIALYEITHCPCIGTDINPDAVSQASKVVDLYSYGHDIHIKQCNILDGIEGMLDVIIINPPYVPTSKDELSMAQLKKDISCSWAGGKDGMEITNEMVKQAYSKLSKNGYIYLLLTGMNTEVKGDIMIKRHIGNELQLVYRLTHNI